jgi:hypothetical protein
MLYCGVISIAAALMVGCGAARSGASAQITEQGRESTRLDFGKVIKDGGWEIPGLPNSEVITPRVRIEKDPPTAGSFITVLKPRLPPINEQREFPEIFSFNIDGAGVMHVIPRKVRVQGIQRYDINGHVFRYKVYLSDIAFAGGEAQVVAKIYAVYYQDEDGDGKFESHYNPESSTSDLFMHVPTWVTGKDNSTPK